MNNELLPCPFCKSTRTKVWFESDHYYHVRCMTCFAQGPTENTDQEAISAWNTRHESGEFPGWLKDKIEDMKLNIASDKNPFVMAYYDALKWVLSLKRDE